MSVPKRNAVYSRYMMMMMMKMMKVVTDQHYTRIKGLQTETKYMGGLVSVFATQLVYRVFGPRL